MTGVFFGNVAEIFPILKLGKVDSANFTVNLYL